MKKLITICLFMATAFSVNAQTPTFEETVNYINNILKENPKVNYFNGGNGIGKYGKRISVEKTGKLVVYNKDGAVGSFNVFDFEKCEASNPYVESEYGNYTGEYITLLGKNNQKLGMFSNLLVSYSTKLEKAFKHLRTFCVKEKDPFGE